MALSCPKSWYTREMSRHLPRSVRLLFGLLALTGVLFCNARVEASESVVLKYRFLRETISVQELSTFAKTGELSTKLRVYLALAKRDPKDLRRVLTQEVPVNPNLLYQVLNSFVGEVMLDRVSEVVHTPSNRANRESLRSALVSSALRDNKIALIETLENYPTPEVHVEGDRLTEVVQRMIRVLGPLPNLKF
jgi:hypothetical protein